LRGYLFTNEERKLIVQFLKTKKRSAKLNVLIMLAQENERRVISDYKFFVALRKLTNEGY
jgi:hypothetical protein